MRRRASALWQAVAKASSGRLARNTGSVVVLQAARLATQAVYFVLIARALNPDGYGAFATAAALVAMVTPFASWGAGDLLVQRVAREPQQFPEEWGDALRKVGAFGLVAMIATILASWLLLPSTVPILLVVSLVVAELWFSAIVSISAQAHQAFENLGRTGGAWLTLSILRMLAAGVMWLSIASPTPLQWGVLYLLASAAAAGLVYASVHRELGPPCFKKGRRLSGVREGFFYSVSLSAASIYNDLDKIMLAWLANLSAVGTYAAGYRAVEMAFVPVMALLHSSYSRFFRAGVEGVQGSLRLCRRLLPIAAFYAILAGIGIYLAAPLLSQLLGPSYSDAVAVAQLLAVLPLIRSTHFFAANTLTGAGRLGWRSACQTLVVVLNAALNLLLIPHFGWRGAVWATLLSEAFLALLLWFLVLFMARRELSSSYTPASRQKGGRRNVG